MYDWVSYDWVTCYEYYLRTSHALATYVGLYNEATYMKM